MPFGLQGCSGKMLRKSPGVTFSSHDLLSWLRSEHRSDDASNIAAGADAP
jgi:hypothetical protein